MKPRTLQHLIVVKWIQQRSYQLAELNGVLFQTSYAVFRLILYYARRSVLEGNSLDWIMPTNGEEELREEKPDLEA